MLKAPCCIFMYIIFQENQNYDDRKQIPGGQGSRVGERLRANRRNGKFWGERSILHYDSFSGYRTCKLKIH